MSDVHGKGFIEVAERCFVARYAAWDVSVGAVLGADGVLLVDTGATARQGADVLDGVRRIAPHLPVRWAVNTHDHFDHTFGNISLPGASIHAHENAAEGLLDSGERIKRSIRADSDPDPDQPAITAEVLADVIATEMRLPDVVFASVSTIDLGDRYVELMHPGRGHTDGDIVIRVPDADVLFAGDLIEESAPPTYGGDCFPLEWSTSLDMVVGMLTDASVVVPGHGSVVDRAFVKDQRADVSDISGLIRSLYAQGVGVDEAVAAGGEAWSFPAARLSSAVRRGYEQLAAAGVHPGSSAAQPPLRASTLPLA